MTELEVSLDRPESSSVQSPSLIPDKKLLAAWEVLDGEDYWP